MRLSDSHPYCRRRPTLFLLTFDRMNSITDTVNNEATMLNADLQRDKTVLKHQVCVTRVSVK